MKLWKCAAIALTLCGTALSLFLTRIMVPTPPHHFPSWDSSSPRTSDSASSSNSSSSLIGRHRKVRSTDGISNILTEFMYMFQGFTEGELKQVIGTLVEKKAQQEARQSKRTKRAKKASKPCSLREVEVTVSELGLGYHSDETLLFRYCSGNCNASRRNYDVILKKWTRKGISKRERSPCCRPKEYDDISFLDNSNRYKTLNEFSALTCGCV
ncbi:neurturin-like [Coregonus clupeaformis]|uniref:neurturin-like n=1 Tax=Coregonus clupeaformis TaxID=59861 RepID=UPI001BDF81C1|nr:neurturin-like [Coregonus clupeaformis]